MTVDDASHEAGVNAWDEVIERLRTLRQSVGNPSYQQLADRVSARREEQGMSSHAARVARTTVYDAFRVGRARPNVNFLIEIAEAMGGSREQVEEWVKQAHAIAPDGDLEEPAVLPPAMKQALLLMVTCVAINMVGRYLVDFLHLPIYLDMVGTAIAAIALGPWRGALVGGVTNVVGVIGSGWVSIPFAIVNIAGALVWGYGIHRFNMGRTLLRFFALNLVVAVVCSIVAVPILVFIFGGSVEQGQDTVTQTFLDLGNGLLAAVGFSNLLTSTIDKVISGFVALVVVTALPWHMRRGIPLVMADHR